MIDYDDETPASAPQLAYDVANYLSFMQRRAGGKAPDRVFLLHAFWLSTMLIWPLHFLNVRAYWRSLFSLKHEIYAVRDGLYYKHFRHGMATMKAGNFRNKLWM